MISLMLPKGGKEGLKVLCLGAHCDDIEIGCGGAILRLAQEHVIAEIKWIVFTSNPVRADEAKKSAEAFLGNVKRKAIEIMSFKDGFLFNSAAEVKMAFEDIKKGFEPDVIFTHHDRDLHQDHSLLSRLTWNTFRSHFILEYEIPKYDGDLGAPNFFVKLEREHIDRKTANLLEHFKSQAGKHWFDRELFSGLARVRGMECAHPYAEAFYVKKITI
ncbi:MAG TPA: PIG-L deacetylase family protein [Cyclobacteriaceae bacterium]|nr:PIG-L deacetylase family protein [Cyclobacteriaceae bacterium]